MIILGQLGKNLGKKTNGKPEVDNWFFEQFERLVPQSEIRFIVYFAVIASLIAIGIYVAFWFKNGFGGSPSTIDYLTEFEDLHERGAFNQEEMSKLKKVVRENLEDDEVDEIVKAAGKIPGKLPGKLPQAKDEDSELGKE